MTTRPSLCMAAALSLACGNKPSDRGGSGELVGGPTTGETDGGSFVVTWSSTPSPIVLGEPVALTLDVTDPVGRWITGAAIRVAVDGPSGAQQQAEEVTELGSGTYETTSVVLDQLGSWQWAFQITADGTTETARLAYGCCER